MEREIQSLIQQMTLEEKAGMCSGKDFWRLKSIPRLGIPEVMLSDGPHGLRKQVEGDDHLGFNDSIKAVCFPTACASACSFDRELLREMGEALGEECQAENVSVILGPAVNIKRSPLCGRNFEYFSEDPYLAAQLAAAHIQGVQSKGAGTSVKHFAANNQEHRRMSCSSQIDERTLREIYLAAFETAVKEGKPDTVMCSYNKINGEFASENHWLLTEVLRDEWGFDGYVMSDWGAVNDRVKGLAAGLDLEMPGGSGATDTEIIRAVQEGTLPETVLNRAVERILKIIFRYTDHRQNAVFDKEKHHRLAEKIAEESMVLLKNDSSILPLPTAGKKIAFIGQFAETPRFQGGGSSHINSFRITSALDAVKDYAEVTYAPGYIISEDRTDDALLAEAVKIAAEADIAVIFAGLPDSFESEGYDREHMRMPDCQNQLIQEITEVQPDTVVVLHNGSPVEMPWAGHVKGILEAYLCGQAVGEATVRLLFGLANPCGKLAETIPLKLEDNPSYLNFPGDGKTVEYREGVFVGYRYYDTKRMDVRYPFGHGLSYTTFEYSNLKISPQTMHDTDTITVSADIRNTGDRPGKEIVQLYVSDRTNAAQRPAKELKNFTKIALEPGETKTISLQLDRRSLSWFCTDLHDWYAASGEYEILLGSSSRDIRLRDTVSFKTAVHPPFAIHANTTIAELLADPRTHAAVLDIAADLGHSMSGGSNDPSASQAASEAITPEMTLKMMENSPLRSLKSFMGITDEELQEIIRKFAKLTAPDNP